MQEENSVIISGKRALRDEDLDSEFEFAPKKKKSTWRNDPIATGKPSHFIQVPTHSAAVPSKEVLVAERDKEEWRARKYHYLAMDAYSRHKALVNQYLLSCGQGIEHFKRPADKDRNDYTVLAEEHRFLWDPGENPQTWEKRLAKAYYDKLFKEYAIADLTRYKENKIAMRWRTEKEVCDGKGQFICGNKHCSKNEDLTSWEVNFSYFECNEHKNALVKLRLCPKCSKKLNHHKKCKVWSKHKHKKLSSKKEKHSKKHKQPFDERSHDRNDTIPITTTSVTEESEDEEAGSSATGGGGATGGSDIWNKPVEAFLEKSIVEEFDDYFKDMLL